MAKRGSSQYKGQKAVGLGLVGKPATKPAEAKAKKTSAKPVVKTMSRTTPAKGSTTKSVKRAVAPTRSPMTRVVAPVYPAPRKAPSSGGIDLGQIARDILSNVPVIGGAASNPRDIGYPSGAQSQRNNQALRRSLGTIKRLR
jgi:hypothetical protein